MATEMLALDSASIRYAEFVKLTMPAIVHTYCNAASDITVNGTVFAGLGSYLGISQIQQDIKASSVDLVVSLTGIDPDNISLILSADIKGSTIEIWRGFLDSNNQIETLSGTQQFFKRYQGIITNIAINEEFNEDARTRVATCTASCASMRIVLDNRVAGIRTNPNNWKFLYPGDTSMDRVPVIASTFFDFGTPPIAGSQSTTANNGASTTADTSQSPGGFGD